MRIPKYVTDYVNTLSERDCRHQYARLLAKVQAEQRAKDRRVIGT